MVARVTRLVAEKFVLSIFPRALTTLSSMCSRAVRALESSPRTNNDDGQVAEMERLRLLVEGVNNKIRVLQRRAYGYRDEEYLKLKIVAAFLPPLPRNAVFNPHESA